MFDDFDGPRWPLRRPERTGVIAICLFFFLTAAIGVGEKRFFAPSLERPPSKSIELVEHSHREKLEAPDVEIQSLRPASPAARSNHPSRCRCHIDTRAPEELVHHHSSQFAMCSLISEADKQWRKGFFAAEEVEMRWHCSDE